MLYLACAIVGFMLGYFVCAAMVIASRSENNLTPDK